MRAAIRAGGATTHLRILSGSGASESVSASGASRRAMDSPRIIYTPRPDATPESEATALGAVYKFVLDCHAKKKGGPAKTALDDRKGLEDDPATTRVPL
jgi:hypothetical protein